MNKQIKSSVYQSKLHQSLFINQRCIEVDSFQGPRSASVMLRPLSFDG